MNEEALYRLRAFTHYSLLQPEGAGNRIWTIQRSNQHPSVSPDFNPKIIPNKTVLNNPTSLNLLLS